jgi:hypothetical protein
MKVMCDVAQDNVAQMEELSYQYDDHIWVTVRGESWAIAEIYKSWIWLWRGYWGDEHQPMEVALLDTNGIDWVGYCNRAVFMLYGDTW